jgi:hypothetical protein
MALSPESTPSVVSRREPAGSRHFSNMYGGPGFQMGDSHRISRQGWWLVLSATTCRELKLLQ